MEREAAYEGMKRRIRAESFEYGEADYRGLFARFDCDKNGFLDRKEFENFCMQMGMRTGLLTEEEREMILTEASNSDDGIVRVREFLQWVSNNNPLFAPNAVQGQNALPRVSSQIQSPSARDVSTAAKRTWSYGESFLEEAERELSQLGPEAVPSAGELPVAVGGRATETAGPAVSKIGGVQTGDDDESELSRVGKLVRAWVDDSVVDSQLESVVYYLLYDLGVAEHSLVGMALSAPGIFGLDVEERLKPNVEFLQELGLSKAKICKLSVSFPQLLQARVTQKEETAAYLEQLGVPRESLGKILAANPQLLRLSISANLQPTVEFLVQEAGVPLAKLGAVILAFPTVLSYSIELNLRPKLRFLLEEVGVEKARIGAVLIKFPQLLGLSISRNLRPTIAYMVQELGLASSEVGKIVQQHPQLLGLSVEDNLKHKVRYLVEELGLPAQRLAAVISSFPTLLSLSVTQNLRPKVQFLLDEAGYDLEDIARSPNLLAYSLERRIRPRFAQLQRMGTRVALGSLLSYSDKDFEKRFGAST